MSLNQGKVALFIDWDNLAISTAADLGGATPDVRAIVQRTQQFGTLIIAKAYAEWQANSDRLAVYRAGIEPAYAPTFRFEPDTATQAGKGKSLADPCMVADCIDALHLFPDINVFVLVTGDKDLIPVVRLAQMRGRKVVVIGPDYVAGVLREMADEFISYRSLVEGAPPRPEPMRRFSPAHEESRRRHPAPTPFVRQDRIPATSPAAPAAPAITSRVTRPEVTEVPAEPVEEQPDLATIHAMIVEILQQRANEGRDRVRATNLKDSLMQRLPGFSERRYGFTKFKDLLTSAERGGLIRLTAAGPVHWISLPIAKEPGEDTQRPAEAPAAMQNEEPVTTAPTPSAEPDRAEMIKFVFDLRHRSRWLTYTYVLTNLISQFSRSLPQSTAESKARATLNYLVQEGILSVDKEPQEVEVGGAKHRVRMCHVNASHPLVIEAMGPASGQELSPDVDAVSEELLPPAPNGQETLETQSPTEGATHAEPEQASSSREGETRGPNHGGHGFDLGTPANGAIDTGGTTIVGADAQAGGSRTASGPGAEIADALVPESAGEGIAVAPRPHDEGPSLEKTFSALERVVRESAARDKRMSSASSVRSRLVQALGTFNERDYGYGRFRDFLAAAQDAGIIRLQVRGHVTLVAPAEPVDADSDSPS